MMIAALCIACYAALRSDFDKLTAHSIVVEPKNVHSTSRDDGYVRIMQGPKGAALRVEGTENPHRHNVEVHEDMHNVPALVDIRNIQDQSVGLNMSFAETADNSIGWFVNGLTNQSEPKEGLYGMGFVGFNMDNFVFWDMNDVVGLEAEAPQQLSSTRRPLHIRPIPPHHKLSHSRNDQDDGSNTLDDRSRPDTTTS